MILPCVDLGIATDSGKSLVKSAATRLGIDNIDSLRLLHAMRDARREPLLAPETLDTPWSARGMSDSDVEVFKSWWLHRLTAPERAQLVEFLGDRAVVRRLMD